MRKGRAVADSSVLIVFAKSRKLDWLLDAFDSPLWIPPAVHAETVQNGLEKREPDAKVVESAVHRKVIRVKKPRRPLVLPFLGTGEAAVLSLAVESRIQTVCLDDAAARNAARNLGLVPVGTLGVLIRLLKQKRINQTQALAAVDDLVKRDFRISAKVLERFRKEIILL